MVRPGCSEFIDEYSKIPFQTRLKTSEEDETETTNVFTPFGERVGEVEEDNI